MVNGSSKSISRVLYSLKGSGGHLSSPDVTAGVMRLTRGQIGYLMPPYSALLRMGFTRPASLHAAGELLPRHFTLTRTDNLPAAGGMFLWH
jgi:hypothetical protein